jgi:hypothetical protein
MILVLGENQHAMRTFFTLSSCAAITLVLAQPTFTLADLGPELGPAPTYFAVDHVPPGPATANFTFNPGSLVLSDGNQAQYLLPGGTPYAASFPLATHVNTDASNPLFYYYEQADATGIQFLGGAGPDYLQTYSDPNRWIAFPLSMGTTWSDPWASTTTSSAFNSSSSGTTSGSYNGYGTLILPWGSFSVGRVEHSVTSTSEISGLVSTMTGSTVNYYALGFRGPLLSISTFEITQQGQAPVTATSASVMDPSLVGIDEHALQGPSFTLFPNPADGNTTLRLGAELVGHIHINVVDMLGRVTAQHNAVGTGSAQDIELDLVGLSAGLYQVLLMDAEGRTATRSLVLR